jgi:hypothetical protein
MRRWGIAPHAAASGAPLRIMRARLRIRGGAALALGVKEGKNLTQRREGAKKFVIV